ncbi:hypothetical protein B0H63DRAFT_449761 [Podospora didyma]|uniref:Uncharacterized protein n=1 Tax=Podospora didyma TaxID=330526 RepID=A0AAE0TZU5_9PEZI|nr:hypothetical protein B0H63DRAFT_449761 [Podospora didyma]
MIQRLLVVISVFATLTAACPAPSALHVRDRDQVPHGQRFPVLDIRQFDGVDGLGNSTRNVTLCQLTPVGSFYKNLKKFCERFVLPFQTCPETPLSTDQIFDLSDGMARCTLAEYVPPGCVPTFRIKAIKIPEVPFELEAYVKSGSHQLTSAWRGTEKIFEEATKPFFDSYYKDPDSSNSDFGSLAEVIQITAVQYRRCALQKPSSEVRACVVDTVSKVQWIGTGMFVWGGQAECEGWVPFIIGIAFTMAMDLANMAIEIWLYRVRGEKPRFSWVKLWWALLSGFGHPILTAYILHRRSFHSSVFALVRVFILAPRISPVIGIVAPFFVGKSWGVQVLTVDSLVAIAGLWTPFISFFTLTITGIGGNSSASSPPKLGLVGFGTLLAAIPGFLFLAIYMLSGLPTSLFYLLGCLFRSSKVFAMGLKILFFWVALAFMFAISPLFALWEAGWILFAGKERRWEFPPLRWFEDTMLSDFWVARALRNIGYWLWCMILFAVFVGRWMILANFFPIAGDSFCPLDVKEAAAESALFVLFTIMCSLGLRRCRA